MAFPPWRNQKPPVKKKFLISNRDCVALRHNMNGKIVDSLCKHYEIEASAEEKVDKLFELLGLK